MLKKIFKKRRILVVTDEEITNLPLSVKSQITLCLGLVVFISWVSFSSGKYFSQQSAIAKKETEVQKANLINIDLQTKIDSLQSNLVRLNEYFNTVREFDYNKTDKKKNKKNKNVSSLGNMYNIFNTTPVTKKRVSFNQKKNALINANINTKTRINNIKKILSMAGLSVSDINFAGNNETNKKVAKVMSFNNQGGPDTTNISPIAFSRKNKNIDDKLNKNNNNDNFANNIEKLAYLENFFNSVPFASPLKRFYITSGFGKRYDPFSRKKAFHYGLDVAGPYGSKILSTAPGIIKFAGRKGNYGNVVEIDHGFNIITRYGHLKKFVVKKGDKVSRGQLIAFQGSTGRSTGAHLHYEIKYNGKHYNPKKFIKAGKYVF
jgi:murein DD-endopeptidase MepM/ murein hydrolase activator NlpD